MNANQDQPVDFRQLLGSMPRASGTPLTHAVYKQSPGDFIVDEVLNFAFANEGDHLCLSIEKTLLNTHDVQQRLASALALKPVDIGYFGLKDKHAVTRQWFSAHYPGKQTMPVKLDLGEGVRVLDQTWHTRKLRIGTHKANRFRITLRDLGGNSSQFGDHVSKVYERGFPNYFAEQRFGAGAQNIQRALLLFREELAIRSTQQGAGNRRKRRGPSRRQRSLYLSAARGFLFNVVLAERVRRGNWLEPQQDEKLLLSGTHSYFEHDQHSENANELLKRLAQQDIHTSGVLWGSGDNIMHWERSYLQPFADLTAGLERAGLQAARRALRATVNDGSICWQGDDTVLLDFELPAGCYATSLLREVCRART